MRVLAKPGRIVPRQNPSDPPINDKVPVDVPETAYYRRRVAEGSLVYAAHIEAQASTEKKKGAVNNDK